MQESDQAFETVTLAQLEALGREKLDQLSYGVVGIRPDTVVEVYNVTEARLSGLDPANVFGVPFFEAIGQCMNNFMVAQRFEDEPHIDDIVPYVLTLRMRPTRVRLRLLASPDVTRRYILIER